MRGPDGIDLKIPRWMIDPAAGAGEISPVAPLPLDLLRAVVERLAIAEPLQAPPTTTDPLLPTRLSGEEDRRGGREAASVPGAARDDSRDRHEVVLDLETTERVIALLARAFLAVVREVEETASP